MRSLYSLGLVTITNSVLQELVCRKSEMNLDSVEGLILVLGFILPGHVILSVRAFLVPGTEQPEGIIAYLRAIHLSLINYALCLPGVYLILSHPWYNNNPWGTAISWGVVILLMPSVWGILWGLSIQHSWSAWIRKKLRIRGVHPTKRAWDHKFGQLRPEMILVTLRDGSTVAGYFGPQSFASSDPTDRDVFIEQLWRINEDGPWEVLENSAGIWLRGSDIRFIEFKKLELTPPIET